MGGGKWEEGSGRREVGGGKWEEGSGRREVGEGKWEEEKWEEVLTSGVMCINSVAATGAIA